MGGLLPAAAQFLGQGAKVGARGYLGARMVGDPVAEGYQKLLSYEEDPKITELKKRKIIRSDGPPAAPPNPFAPPDPMQLGAVDDASLETADPLGWAQASRDPETQDVFGTVGGELARGRQAVAAASPAPLVAQAGLAELLQSPVVKPPDEKAPDVFLKEELDDEWRYGPLNDRKILPQKPHEPSRDAVGKVSAPGPAEEAQVLMSSGGRTYDYTNSAKLSPELRVGGGRGNSSQLRVQGNPLAPEPDPELGLAVQSRSREALMRGLEDPYYLEDERYRRRKAIDAEYRNTDREDVREEGKSLIREFEHELEIERKLGGDDLEDRIREATDALNRELAVLGMRPHTPLKRY